MSALSAPIKNKRTFFFFFLLPNSWLKGVNVLIIFSLSELKFEIELYLSIEGKFFKEKGREGTMTEKTILHSVKPTP